MVEVMKTMVTPFKWSHAHKAELNAPYPAAGHCQPMAPPDTLGHSQANLGQSLVGVTAPFSWILVHKVLCVPSKSLFPQSCVTSGSSMVRLMVTSSKRTYATPKSTALRAPASAAVRC